MIDRTYFWTSVLCLAVGTLAIRGSIIAISSRVRIPARWQELFSFIPAAILPAFVAPAVYFHHGRVEALLGKERVVAILLATAVCYLTRSTLATIAFGLCALYVATSALA